MNLFSSFIPTPRGAKNRVPDLSGRARRSQNQFTPPRLRVAASAEQGWGWGNSIDFQAPCKYIVINTNSRLILKFVN